jgi:hypothetical protein
MNQNHLATLTKIDGGFRIAETETHYLDVIQMLYNWRLCETPKSCPLSYDRSWCYAGNGLDGLLTAVIAAIAWGRNPDAEPVGWIRNNQTGEYREYDEQPRDP